MRPTRYLAAGAATVALATLSLPAHALNIDYDDTDHYDVGVLPKAGNTDWFTLYVGWVNDPDGHGIRIKALHVRPWDCSEYEDHPAHINRLTVRNSADTKMWQVSDFDMTDCSLDYAPNLEVNKSLCADVWLSLDPKVDNEADPGEKKAHVQICVSS